MRRATALTSLGLLVAVCLVGCGDKEKKYEFSDIREAQQPTYRGTQPMSPHDRFNLPESGMSGNPHAGMGGSSLPQPEFTWKVPDGWENREASGMRKGSWRVAGQDKTDVSLTFFQGMGGGLLPNVNRWRGEMGLEPTSEAEADKLPKTLLLGRQATYVDLVGDFSGGRGTTGPVKGARMLGLILTVGQATAFLKFTGPADVVTANKDKFDALAASLDFKQPAASGHAGGGMGHGSSSGYAFDTPQGWTQKPGSAMRIVTFVPDDLPHAWCYAIQLGGDGGGLAMNVNRWRGEMGQSDLDDAAIAKLPTLDVLGIKAPMLDLTGDFAGTGGPAQNGARMFGVICERPAGVLFVKMVGPKDQMEAQRERFIAFCTSLREK